MDTVLEFLQSNAILYKLFRHEPVFTVEQARETRKTIDGLHCKNLFIRNQKGNKHFLVIFPADMEVDLKMLALQVGITKISFASAKRLQKYLGVKPGSVSVFGLLNDKDKLVELFLHEDVLKADIVTFHPNDNSATISLSKEQFQKVLKKLERTYSMIP